MLQVGKMNVILVTEHGTHRDINVYYATEILNLNSFASHQF